MLFFMLYFVRPIIGTKEFSPENWPQWEATHLTLTHGFQYTWLSKQTGVDRGCKGGGHFGSRSLLLIVERRPVDHQWQEPGSCHQPHN